MRVLFYVWNSLISSHVFSPRSTPSQLVSVVFSFLFTSFTFVNPHQHKQQTFIFLPQWYFSISFQPRQQATRHLVHPAPLVLFKLKSRYHLKSWVKCLSIAILLLFPPSVNPYLQMTDVPFRLKLLPTRNLSYLQ